MNQNKVISRDVMQKAVDMFNGQDLKDTVYIILNKDGSLEPVKWKTYREGKVPIAVMNEDGLYIPPSNIEEFQGYSFEVDPSEVFVKIEDITSKKRLKEISKELGVRDDWHEPGEQDVSAEITGDHLDNAGFPDMEYTVTLYKDDKPVARILLATLLAFAIDGYEGF